MNIMKNFIKTIKVCSANGAPTFYHKIAEKSPRQESKKQWYLILLENIDRKIYLQVKIAFGQKIVESFIWTLINQLEIILAIRYQIS